MSQNRNFDRFYIPKEKTASLVWKLHCCCSSQFLKSFSRVLLRIYLLQLKDYRVQLTRKLLKNVKGKETKWSHSLMNFLSVCKKALPFFDLNINAGASPKIIFLIVFFIFSVVEVKLDRKNNAVLNAIFPIKPFFW